MMLEYEWENYISPKRLQKIKGKYTLLFQIRDSLLKADSGNQEKVSISFPDNKDEREILAIAGSLHYWWVIDYVIQEEGKTTLLYRNCKKHKDTDPAELWAEFIPTFTNRN